MSTYVALHDSRPAPPAGSRKERTPDDGTVRHRIDTAVFPEGGKRREVSTLAYIERELPSGGREQYLKDRKSGVRSFALWEDAHREKPWARVVTLRPAAEDGEARYEVRDPYGEPLAEIGRRRALTGGAVRTRWTVRQDGGTEAAGSRGRPFWWVVWWLLFPVQAAIVIGGLVAGGGDGAGMPRRTRFFAEGERVLDFRSGELEAVTDGWDPRVLAAMIALQDSYGGVAHASWDA
ncbi:hypothetical protein [Streptomyces sp. ODS28]|uniref:hypothetical protein n=1 Tax=Streptomyces sp. ODS28 TaxID=3136688 RepID=UPI0031F1AD8C